MSGGSKLESGKYHVKNDVRHMDGNSSANERPYFFRS